MASEDTDAWLRQPSTNGSLDDETNNPSLREVGAWKHTPRRKLDFHYGTGTHPECYWGLLWALGYIEELSRPDHICDVPRAVQIMVDRTAEEFIQDAKLRSACEILDATDLIYRYEWACVDARINGRIIPNWLECGESLKGIAL